MLLNIRPEQNSVSKFMPIDIVFSKSRSETDIIVIIILLAGSIDVHDWEARGKSLRKIDLRVVISFTKWRDIWVGMEINRYIFNEVGKYQCRPWCIAVIIRNKNIIAFTNILVSVVLLQYSTFKFTCNAYLN